MVGKEIGLSISGGENNSKGGNSQAIRMQNPEPVEIFNSGSLKGEKPFRRAPSMRQIEEQDNKSTVKKAVESGDFGRLTQKQQHILEIRGYLGKESLVPFRKLMELEELGITFQSAFGREARAFRRLENGGVRSKMRPEEREFILNNPRLPATKLAVILRHKRGTINSWKDQVGVARRPVGRPRKSGVSS